MTNNIVEARILEKGEFSIIDYEANFGTIALKMSHTQTLVFMEINRNYPDENKQWPFFSKLSTARESATIPCIWKSLRHRQGSVKAL